MHVSILSMHAPLTAAPAYACTATAGTAPVYISCAAAGCDINSCKLLHLPRSTASWCDQVSSQLQDLKL
jgi:hypothetical protein